MKGYGVLWSVDVIMSGVCVQGCTCGVFYCV